MLGAAAARNLGSVFQNIDLDTDYVDELDPGDYNEDHEQVEEPEVYDVIFAGQIHEVTDGTLSEKARRKLKKLFRLIDSDGNNYLDRDEFREAICSAVSTGYAYGSDVMDNPIITDSDFGKVFDEVNKSNDGVVDFKELWDFLKPWNVQSADSEESHGDLYNLLKYKFLKAMSHPVAKGLSDDHEYIGNRFKRRFKIVVPTRELVELESKLIGGADGYGLYVGQDMPPCACKIPTGSILITVGDKVIETMKSQDLREIIHFTEDNEHLVCSFKNYGSLSKSQRKNIPEGVWMKLTKFDRDNLMMTEREIEVDDGPFIKENYPPGHNRHTPDKRARPMAYRLHRTMEDETYSSLSFVITILVMTMIVVSTLAYILETVPPLEHEDLLWTTIETTVSIAFTVEYTLRIISCKSPWAYFWDFMNMVDFLAFIPFWIEYISNKEGSAQLRVIRVIRLARIIRLMKSPTFSTYLTIFKNTFNSAISSLGLLVTISMLEIIVCGSLAYVAERGSATTIGVCEDWITNTAEYVCTGGVHYNFDRQYSNEDCLLECVDSATEGCCEFNQRYLSCVLYRDDSDVELVQGDVLSLITPALYSSNCVTEEVVVRYDGVISPFFSIPNAMWWCVVTMTTVGYGDMYPIYTWGRCIGVMTMFSGLLVIALPVIIIGKDFENANTAQTRKNNRKQSSLDALAILKNDRKGTVEEFFKEVNDHFASQYNKQKEAGTSQYEYQAVSFNHEDESSFYEAGFKSKHEIESILSCKRGFVYLPNYLHIPPPNASGYKNIPMYSVFSLWHHYGQLLRKGKSKRTRKALEAK